MGLRGYNNPRQFSDVLSGQDCTLRERTKAGVYTQNHSVVSVMGTCTDAWRGIRSYLAAYARHPDCRNRSNHHRSQNHVTKKVNSACEDAPTSFVGLFRFVFLLLFILALG